MRVFRHISRQVRDSDGHSHPGDPHEARQALLTITADDGSEGHCLSPVEVVRARGAVFKFRGQGMVGDKVAAECEFAAMLVET